MNENDQRMSKILDYSICLFIKSENNFPVYQWDMTGNRATPMAKEYCMQFPKFIQSLIYHFYSNIMSWINSNILQQNVKIQKIPQKKRKKKLEKDNI